MEKIQIPGEGLRRMCRVCLDWNNKFVDIFAKSSVWGCQIADVLTACASVHISKQDGLSSFMCETCFIELERTRQFRLLALESEKTMHQYLSKLTHSDKQFCEDDIKDEQNSIFNGADNHFEEEEINEPDIKLEVASLPSLPPYTDTPNEHALPNQTTNYFNIENIISIKPEIPESVASVKRKRGLQKNKSATTKQYKCDICNKCFTQNCSLKVHQRSHTSEKPYQCEVCSKCFAQSGHLSEHKRRHSDEKRFQCEVCNKRFVLKIELVRHKRFHTGEKPYQCDICGKCCSVLSNLKIHKRTHTGEKPYQCDVCSKCFAESSSLVKHKRRHTDEKPYQCKECGKCFADSSTLIAHRRCHTGEKPFSCDVCNKGFTQSSNLKKHKRRHTGEKPYRCDVCSKCYADSTSLNSHKRSHATQEVLIP